MLGAYPGSYRIAIIIEGTTLPDIWSFEIIDNPVGLNELGEKQFIAVFPNPAQKFITVQSTREISGVILYDITGSLLSARTAESASVEIPLDEYPPGIYFLHVAILGEQTVIKKIVIQ